MAPTELRDPVPYPLWWLVLGCAMILAAIMLVVLVLRLTRRPAHDRRHRPRGAPIRADHFGLIRAEHSRQLAVLGQRHSLGELDDRAVYQGISVIVRSFAAERTGVDVRTLTLSELEGPQLTRLRTLIGETYRPSFADPGDDQPRDPNKALRVAQMLVSRW